MAEFDLSTMSVSEMNALRLAIDKEIKDREVIANAEVEIEEIANRYLKAVGREEGSEWVQPEGAHEAYPAGYIATHLGKEWVSLVRGNVWEPGVSAWREVVPEGAAAPEWVQPTGEHDSYAKGNRVTHNGIEWTSSVNGNVWTPEEATDLWIPEEPEEEIPVEQEPPLTDPEPEPETIPEFVQPTGAHDTYNTGDKVLFEGNVYESVIDNNAYSPAAYPAGWRQIS